MINQLIDVSVRKIQHIYAVSSFFLQPFLFEYNSFHLTVWYLSATRRIRPAVPTPSHVPLPSTNCAERCRKNKEQKKLPFFIKHHDLSGICRMTLQPGFPIQIFHLSSGRRPYRFSWQGIFCSCISRMISFLSASVIWQKLFFIILMSAVNAEKNTERI